MEEVKGERVRRATRGECGRARRTRVLVSLEHKLRFGTPWVPELYSAKRRSVERSAHGPQGERPERRRTCTPRSLEPETIHAPSGEMSTERT